MKKNLFQRLCKHHMSFLKDQLYSEILSNFQQFNLQNLSFAGRTEN